MRLAELGVLYLIVGIGCALALALARRGRSDRAVLFVDASLLVPFWPLYGPFLFLREGDAGDAPRAGAEEPPPSIAALRRATGAPLSDLLPDRAMAAALEERLALARDRVDEIDRLLSQPDFDEEAALARHDELDRGGDERAAATARSRVAAIGRLRGLRERFLSELTEIGELLAQLRVQAELLRLAGDGAGAPGDVVGELAARLESLDEILGAEDPVA